MKVKSLSKLRRYCRYRKLLCVLAMLALFIHVNVLAQETNIKVSGTVSDTKGNLLPGVSVRVKGNSAGVATDIAGKFAINAPANGTLIFSFVGFTSQEIAINGLTNINVRLQESNTSLNEVVVTALGIERQKKTLTYSTQSVGTADLTKNRELNIVNALQGKVAGLSISAGSSGVGSDSRVILRGNRSISGNSQPLYVIDGVPVRSDPSDINPDNIASINVLKGANAAALYGSSGQNGVIIIETKKGRQGVHVTLNNTYAVQNAVQSIPFQYEYGQGAGGIYNKASEDSWGPALDGTQVAQWSLNPVKTGTTYAFLPQNNVREGIFQTGHNFATNLAVSAGNEKNQTAFNYTYTNSDGIIPNNALQRHNIALRLTNQLSKNLSLDTKLDYTKQNIDNKLDEGESSFNPIRQIYTMPPNISAEDVKDFEYVDPSLGITKQNYWAAGSVTGANPYWALNRNLRYNKSDRVIALAALTYQIMSDLKFRVRGSYDGERTGNEEKSYYGTYRDPSGRYLLGNSSAQQSIGDFLLSYDKKIKTLWSVQANVGGEVKDIKTDDNSAYTNAGLNVPNLFALTNSSQILATNSFSHIQTQSLYANAQLGWHDALFVEASARNDWDSTLPASNRSYFYPSVGASAIISELTKLPEVFSYLKLRGSLAVVGNGAAAYQLQRFASSVAGGSTGYILLGSTLPNSVLQPEKTTSTELGLEMNMFNNRIGLDATFYKTNTNNQLFQLALPVGSGAATYYTNGGDIQNKGIELILNTTPVKSDKFTWDVNFNYAKNINVVKRLATGLPKLVVGSDSYMREFDLEEGKPFGQIYGKGFARDAQNRVIVGTNGIPQYTAGRTVLLGNINPDWTGGISTSFSYKNWNASILISHKQGGSVASFTDAILYGSGLVKETVQGRSGGLVFGQNIFTNYVAVKADGTPNTTAVNAETLWKSMGARTSPVGEAFTRSTTNTRVREMSIGYKFTKAMLGKLPVSSVDLSLVARNLFFLYRKSPDIDPDYIAGTTTVSEGFQSFAPPTTRSFGVNLRINF